MKLHLWYHNNALANTRYLESFQVADKGNSLMFINASHIKMDFEYVNHKNFRIFDKCELYILVLCPSFPSIATHKPVAQT